LNRKEVPFMSQLVKSVKTLLRNKTSAFLTKMHDYCQLIWTSSNLSGLNLFIQTGDSLTHFQFNSFTSIAVIFTGAILTGVCIGCSISTILMAYHFIKFQFFFKKNYPNAKWRDYIAHLNMKARLQTRGGDLLPNDVFTSVETNLNNESVIATIKRQCFKKTGLYKISEYWQSIAVGNLYKVGLVTSHFVNRTSTLKTISVDGFLLSISTHQTPKQVRVAIRFQEFSAIKLWFNLVSLVTIGLFTTVSVTSFATSIFIRLFGIPTFLGIPINYLNVFALNSLKVGIYGGVVYVTGQFVPARCSNFAELIEGAGFDKDGRPVFPGELPNSPVIIVPPLPGVPDSMPFVPQNPTDNLPIIDVDPVVTVGDLDQEPSIAERYANANKNRNRIGTIETIAEKIDDTYPVDIPVQKPTYQKIKEEIGQLAQDEHIL
jgi:hypothetical protein